MLSASTIATVKATVPVLKEHGETLTRYFYERMFKGNPEVQAFFNPAHQHSGSQQKALAGAICAYAEHIENPGVLMPAIELIAQKHASLGIKAEHYPIVGKHLLGSIKEVLGEGATDEVILAWGEAYQFLAEIFIKREGEIYAHHTDHHGWQGFDAFVVTQKQNESDTIQSLYLTSKNGGELPHFEPGQFLSVRVPGVCGHYTTMRNYSLSCKPGDPHYRISVKREPARCPAAPSGHVSNYLHDQIKVGDVLEIGPPCGKFILEKTEDASRPLVLISGGVGITPMLSMLHSALENHPGRTIYFIHGTLNSQTHAFRQEVQKLHEKHANLRLHVRYSNPSDMDLARLLCHDTGLLDMSLIKTLVRQTDADFYFCGPKPMMALFSQGLHDWGVATQHIRYEFFGPAEALAVK